MSRANRYRNTRQNDNQHQGKGHCGLALLIIIGLLGVAGWFWLARNPDMRTSLLAELSQLERTLLGKANTFLSHNTTPPPPPEIGAVAGSVIPGAPPLYDTIKTPEQLEKALAEPHTLQTNGAEVRGEVAKDVLVPADAGRKDDQVVRIAFIDDLATWLVGNYTPAASGRGKISASLQSANHRYGVGMTGLAWIGEDLPAGRTAALNHVFTPGMLDALYKLYIDRFMEAVDLAVETPNPEGKLLSPAQKADFYRQYAQTFRGLSGTLSAIAALPDFSQQMAKLAASAQHVITTNARYSELTFALDQARENKDTSQIAALRTQMAKLGHDYQQAVIAREQAHTAFARLLKKNAQARFDNDTMLYIAAWIERRTHNNPEKIQAARQAATLFQNLAQQFEEAGASAGAAQ